MNVRVNLNSPIYDGAEIVFKAPCDASEVTGLIVYYPSGTEVVSSVFTFADAHTNDLGDIDDLFAEGAVVKVIIDTETNMAFVQNAATNAYLESRFAGMGGGGANTLIVTLDNNRVASHNSTQIYNHVASGGNVILRISLGNDVWKYVNLSHLEPSQAYFMEMTDDDFEYSYIVDESANCNQLLLIPVPMAHLEANYYTKGEIDNTFASKSYVYREATRIAITAVKSELDTTLSISGKSADAKAVGDALGNISSALDGIIAIQNELIGGDS